MSTLVAPISETGTLSSARSIGPQSVRVLAQRFQDLSKHIQNMRRELSPKSEHLSHQGLVGRLTPEERATSTCDQMFNPVHHVLAPGVLFSGPAIGLQRFRIPAQGLQRLSQEI